MPARLPAVVYGHGIESSNISVDGHDFEQLRRHIGPNALVDLSIDGKKARPVLVHGIHVHPVNRRTLHVDLFLVRMTEEMTVDVPLSATGESPAVNLHGGTLLHPIESVKVRALPDHLPQVLEYSIEGLVDFDATVHVRDLVVPSDVTLLTDGDEIVAKVQAPRVEEEPVVAAEAAEPRARRRPRVPRAARPRAGRGGRQRGLTTASVPRSRRGRDCETLAGRAVARDEDDRIAHRHRLGREARQAVPGVDGRAVRGHPGSSSAKSVSSSNSVTNSM